MDEKAEGFKLLVEEFTNGSNSHGLFVKAVIEELKGLGLIPAIYFVLS